MVGVEELGDVVVGGGGEVEGGVVGLEVGVDGVDVGGEVVVGGVGGHGLAEDGEEGGPEGLDPLGVEVLERADGLLAAEESCETKDESS